MKHFSPSADATLVYGSELLTLDAATVIGRRASGRISRRIPRGAPVARIEMVTQLRQGWQRFTRALVAVAVSGGRW